MEKRGKRNNPEHIVKKRRDAELMLHWGNNWARLVALPVFFHRCPSVDRPSSYWERW